ncbi:serine hydrolase [Pistricoccus aurantiacus]|uniref:serine hydrolase n=1 Tax=Pistricoccus aurantiacus TaxID=1883414 RepID=UPI0036420575
MSGAAQAANPRYASIVVDATSGNILHAANAEESRYPASLTKMMTLYLLFEAIEEGRVTLDQPLYVSSHAASMPASKLWLNVGSTISVEEAIPALVVTSANDVAVVVAEALGGTETNFARLMTQKAQAFGMQDTQFRNASGLPDAAQVTTARDMAVLSVHLMRDFPQYYQEFSRKSYVYQGKSRRGHNRLLSNYEGADGLKTGFIRASGFNVATSAIRDNRRVIAVVMGGYSASSRDEHMAELMDDGFTRLAMLSGRDWSGQTDIYGNATPLPALASAIIAPTMANASRQIASASPASTARRRVTNPDAATTTASYVSSSSPSQAQGSADPIAELVERRSRPGPAGEWAVQVGAFKDAGQARHLASRAADYLGAQQALRVDVMEVAVSDSRMFRARLVDLQEDQARSVCSRLSARGMDCLVVR